MAEEQPAGQLQFVGPRANPRLQMTQPEVSEAPAELTLESIYRQHASFVWRCLRRFGVPEAELEDRMHDVFIVVGRRLGEFDGRAAITSWLYGIARGIAANDRRSRTRSRRHLEQIGESEQARVEGGRRSPDDELRHRRALAMIAEFLPQLEAEILEPFVLVDLEGLKPRDAAEALGRPNTEIHRCLRNARRRFASYIRGQRGQPT